jgi:hypothetical protein
MRRVQPARFFANSIFALAAALSISTTARAYCRAVTEAIPDDWPQDTECFTGSAAALEVYWKTACVSYSLQQNASKQVPFDQASAVAARAFAAWKNVDCPGGGHPSIDATHDMSPVECSAVQYNENGANQNLIVFRDDAWPHPGQFNTLGLTRLKYGVTSGEIFDADMEINSTADRMLVVQGPPTANQILLESVITHEAGHFLGLGHSTDPKAIMYAKYHPDSVALSDDDKAGICAIYPPDGTRRAKQAMGGAVPEGDCDPMPHNGFSGACDSPPTSGTSGTSGTLVMGGPVHRSSCSVSLATPAEKWMPFVASFALALARLRRLRRTKSPRAQVTIK